MKKTLSERIAEAEMRQPLSQSSKNRVAFLSQRQEIAQAIVDGYSVKQIWEQLHHEKKIDFTYQAFRGYVNRLILLKPQVEKAEKQKPTTEQLRAEQLKPVKADAENAPRGFTFNPRQDPKDFL